MEILQKKLAKGYKIKAVLSTTVLPLDGVYQIVTLPKGQIPDITGVPHYIGHPATREIVESLGAVKAPSNLFEGLNPDSADCVGYDQVAVCFPITQGKSTRAVDGKTVDQQVSIGDLSVRLIVRLDSGGCGHCGTPAVGRVCFWCGAS